MQHACHLPKHGETGRSLQRIFEGQTTKIHKMRDEDRTLNSLISFNACAND
jgi:hypothetical protein